MQVTAKLDTVSDYTLALSKTACDIHLKHVFLTELGLWRNPAPKLRHIPFRFFGYHKLARTVVILNISPLTLHWDKDDNKLNNTRNSP